jgi:diguanylate cyclase (GGDEF)-like protein
MSLDMPTISAVSISVTALLGFVLIFTWSIDRKNELTGWWGVAQLLMSGGIIIAVISARSNNGDLHAFGQAWMLLSSALMWLAVRRFEGRELHTFWIVIWPTAFLLAQIAGLFPNFDIRLVVACAMLAVLSFAAAWELVRDFGEPLHARWPAAILLIITGAGYLTWLPLTLRMPIYEASQLFTSTWFPIVVLGATLGRIALSFIVLVMEMERQEYEQRMDALTDPLTGLPNRRALFEAADRLAQQGRFLKGESISVLVFDLDHFKKVNDTYGHRLGDRVLQIFADILSDNLNSDSIVGRLGGEEFAAILPGATLTKAAEAAEKIRTSFATTATVIDGAEVSGTVSVGAACHDALNCDIAALFHRADGALYAAKSAGRNRVELLAPHESLCFAASRAAEADAAEMDGYDYRPITAPRSIRRYRDQQPKEVPPVRRARRSRPALT